MASINPPRPPSACPMKRTRAVSAASRSKVFNRFPVIFLFSSQARRAPNKKDLLRIANHGAAKGLDLSALSGLAEEPDRLSPRDRPDDSFRSSRATAHDKDDLLPFYEE